MGQLCFWMFFVLLTILQRSSTKTVASGIQQPITSAKLTTETTGAISPSRRGILSNGISKILQPIKEIFQPAKIFSSSIGGVTNILKTGFSGLSSTNINTNNNDLSDLSLTNLLENGLLTLLPGNTGGIISSIFRFLKKYGGCLFSLILKGIWFVIRNFPIIYKIIRKLIKIITNVLKSIFVWPIRILRFIGRIVVGIFRFFRCLAPFISFLAKGICYVMKKIPRVFIIVGKFIKSIASFIFGFIKVPFWILRKIVKFIKFVFRIIRCIFRVITSPIRWFFKAITFLLLLFC